MRLPRCAILAKFLIYEAVSLLSVLLHYTSWNGCPLHSLLQQLREVGGDSGEILGIFQVPTMLKMMMLVVRRIYSIFTRRLVELESSRSHSFVLLVERHGAHPGGVWGTLNSPTLELWDLSTKIQTLITLSKYKYPVR
jgi:hypothetical protein